jgi:nicotinamidase-related amidase
MSGDDKRLARLSTLLDPATTAVVTNEMQQGIIGGGVMLPALADAVAERGTVANAARVCAAARRLGVRVVHCTVEQRADGAGHATNCTIFAMSEKMKDADGLGPTTIGTEGVKLVPELAGDPRDIVVPRMHGMTPMTSTSLDQILRNLGVSTVVVMGVSVNLGITGVPNSYADAVIDNSLSLISTVTTADELCELWAKR